MKFRAASLVVVLGLLAGSTDAAPVLIVSGGILQGATGVIVGGGTYDVSFVDGTCAALFTGCDQVTDFTFQTLGHAAEAAGALLDSVFLDGAAGNFDTSPDLTNGCASTPTTTCIALIPYNRTLLVVDTTSARNLSQELLDGINLFGGVLANSYDSGTDSVATWAAFSPTAPVAPVPEPAALTLLALGGVGLGCYRRRRRR